MFDTATPDPSDPALRITADAYHHLVRTLQLVLPPPMHAGAGAAPEDFARRDRAAIARIAALAPANFAEAELATQFVAASEQWKECLGLAQRPETSPELATKCRAQALAMMRQANAALRLLLRLQNRRDKIEADNAARDRAAWTEHCALALMADVLAEADPPAPANVGAGPRAAPEASGEAPASEPIPAAAARAERQPPPLAPAPCGARPDPSPAALSPSAEPRARAAAPPGPGPAARAEARAA